MKFFIDTANLSEIQEAYDLGVLDGVTTNPSLMAKEGIAGQDRVLAHYKAICNIVDDNVSAEVIATDFDGMVREGKELAKIDDKTPCFFLHLPPEQSNAKDLVLQCLDRMLRPSCIDVGAGAILFEGKFLAARRSQSEKHAGWWEFPGGKVEKNETFEDALKREIKEELNIEIKIHSKLGEENYKDDKIDVKLHYFYCSYLNGNIKLTEHEDSAWVSKEEFSKGGIIVPTVSATNAGRR